MTEVRNGRGTRASKAAGGNGSTPDPEPGTRSSSVRSERVRVEIYEQAERLFAERGYAGTTPQDIADAVGISRQSLYYYVKSKDEILAALVAETTTTVLTAVQGIVREAPDPRSALRDMARYLVRDRALNRSRFRLLDKSESALSENLAAAHLDGRRQALALLIEVIEAGILDGSFATSDSRVAALTIIGMCNSVAWWFEPGPDRPVEPIAAQIAEAALATLSPLPADPLDVPPDGAAVITAIEQQLTRLRSLLTQAGTAPAS